MSDGARVGANDGSNPSNVGAIPTAPAISEFKAINFIRSDEELEAYVQERIINAFEDRGLIYIDDATGIQVSEDWWPGDEHDTP